MPICSPTATLVLPAPALIRIWFVQWIHPGCFRHSLCHAVDLNRSTVNQSRICERLHSQAGSLRGHIEADVGGKCKKGRYRARSEMHSTLSPSSFPDWRTSASNQATTRTAVLRRIGLSRPRVTHAQVPLLRQRTLVHYDNV